MAARRNRCLRVNICCAGSPPLIGNRIPFRILPKSVQSNRTTSQQSLRQTTGSPRPCVQGTRGGRPGPCGIHPHHHSCTRSPPLGSELITAISTAAIVCTSEAAALRNISVTYASRVYPPLPCLWTTSRLCGPRPPGSPAVRTGHAAYTS